MISHLALTTTLRPSSWVACSLLAFYPETDVTEHRDAAFWLVRTDVTRASVLTVSVKAKFDHGSRWRASPHGMRGKTPHHSGDTPSICWRSWLGAVKKEWLGHLKGAPESTPSIAQVLAPRTALHKDSPPPPYAAFTWTSEEYHHTHSMTPLFTTHRLRVEPNRDFPSFPHTPSSSQHMQTCM